MTLDRVTLDRATLRRMGRSDASGWNALVSMLSSFATVTQRDPHGLVVQARRSDGSHLYVEIVMTPEEWTELVHIPIGDLDSALEFVRDHVLEQPRDQRYLVYTTYDLEPQDTPEKPIDHELLEMQAYAAQFPGGVIPGAYWSADPPGTDTH